MPTRELLTPTQRLPFLGIPPDLDERAITRLSTFTAPDLARIRQHRRDWNRLGFAVQLAYLRYPGIAWDPTMPLPMPVLTFIAAQVGAPPATLADYALRDPTRREHLAEIIQAYGYQTFSVTAYRELAAWLMPLALSTDRGLTLVEALVAEVRTRQLVRPALSTLERLAWETRKRAQQQIYTTLAGALTTTQREQMDALLQVSPPKNRRTCCGCASHPAQRNPPRCCACFCAYNSFAVLVSMSVSGTRCMPNGYGNWHERAKSIRPSSSCALRSCGVMQPSAPFYSKHWRS